jgi:hypothetical protein
MISTIKKSQNTFTLAITRWFHHPVLSYNIHKKKVKHPHVFWKWQMIQVSRDYWLDNLKNAIVTCSEITLAVRNRQKNSRKMLIQWIFNHNITRPVFAVKHVYFKYWPSQLKKHDNIVISISKRHLWITWRHLLFKVQYRLQPPRTWMTASTLRLIPTVRRRMSCCDSCCHTRCNAASNWRMFCTGGHRACIRRPNMSQICYMGFKSGFMAGQGT